MRVPPDLLPPEGRAPRIAELEREVADAWVRFAVLDALVCTGPLAFVTVLWALDRIEAGAAIAVGVAAVLGGAVLAAATVLRKVAPARRELAELRRLEGSSREPGA